MNLCLTTQCNNNCAYCFQKELHSQSQEMTLEQIEHLLLWSRSEILDWHDNISLLGGEPTQHPQLIEIIQTIKKIYPTQEITLISNLLCSSELIARLSQFNHIHYLVNTTHSSLKHKQFIDNLQQLAKTTKNICLSITLLDDYEQNIVTIKYLNQLLTEVPNIQRIRVGLMMPGPQDKWVIIYNYERELLYLLEQEHIKNLKAINFDCPINFCQISKNFYKHLIQYNNIHALKQKCSGPPLDLLPTNCAKYCYSTPDSYNYIDVFKYADLHQLKYVMANDVEMYKIQNNKCKTCELYQTRQCYPCRSVDLALKRGEELL